MQFLEFKKDCKEISKNLPFECLVWNEKNSYLSTTKYHSNKTNKNQIFRFEYHVLFSKIYQVPVLYFNIYKEEEDKVLHIYDRDLMFQILKDLFDVNVNNLNTYQFISQEEHPIFQSIFFYIHPCKTKEFINGNLLKKSKNKTLSWLSYFSQQIGLKIKMSKEVKELL